MEQKMYLREYVGMLFAFLVAGLVGLLMIQGAHEYRVHSMLRASHQRVLAFERTQAPQLPERAQARPVRTTAQ